MKKITLIFTLLHIFCLTFGQNAKNKIVKVIDKKTYSLIPLSLLNDTTINGIISPFRIGKSNELVIFWNSVCIDGSYNLTITPEQIYLTSSHENPNPNKLYWIIPIRHKIYSSIFKGFEAMKLKKSFFDSTYNDSKILPDNFTDSTFLIFYDKCDNLRELQIDKMLTFLNNIIADKKNQIDEKKKIILKEAIYFGNNKQEIQSWQPKIIKRAKYK